GHGFIANAADMYEHALGIPRYSEILPPALTQNAHNIVVEDMLSAYFQIALNGELGNMPYSVLTGLRYETTDVDSSSLSSAYFWRWESDNDISINADPDQPQSLASAEADYDNLLPSFDLTLNLTD